MRLILILGVGMALAHHPAAAQDPLPGSLAYAAADRAYRAAERGDVEVAVREARIAAEAAPHHQPYRELLFYQLIAARHTDEALEVGASIIRDFGPSPAIDIARAGQLVAAGRAAEARILLQAAVGSGDLEPQQDSTARLLLADAALNTGDPAVALSALEPLEATTYDVSARRGFALAALDRPEEALEAFEAASPLAPDLERRSLITRSRIRLLGELGRTAEARTLLDLSLADGVLAQSSPLELAYLAQAVGNKRLAFDQFLLAERQVGLEGASLLDAAYNARVLGAEELARSRFRKALEENRAGRFDMDPQSRLYLTQELQNIADQFGGYASISRTPTGTAVMALPGAVHSTYAGGEIYWRPTALRRHVDVFARTFVTLDTEIGATGGETAQAYLGARLRPWTDHNILFEVSHLMPIGNEARTDWLLRAAGSLAKGSDLQLNRRSWQYWTLYGEVGQFLSHEQTIGNFEARWGHSLRIGGVSSWSVIAPFVGARFSYDSAFEDEAAFGGGPGFWFRRGLGAGPWRAPDAWFDLVTQYRFRIAGGEQEQGVFIGASLAWSL